MDDFDDAPRRKATGFVVLSLLALIVAATAIYLGHAPIDDRIPSDWINWAQRETTWAGLLVLGMVILMIGLVGWAIRAFAPSPKPKRASASTPAPRAADIIPAAAAIADNKGSLKFEAAEEPAPVLFAVPPVSEVHSLEPAVFHDNASDSFLSQTPVQTAAPAALAAADVLSDTHGLHVGGAQIIPIRPDIAVGGNDPVEAALLAEPAAAPSPAPQSDMGAVIASAMHFAGESEPAIAAPAAAAASADGDGEIAHAVQMALSVWPDATRAIAGEELKARVSHLYYDRSPESARAFHLIATGDLSAAAAALQDHADALARQGRNAEAAEQWRIYGALHMGRDDGKAMTAYEKVSELDPSDANIHLYLARRYQMAGETGRMPAVLGRALAVISDPQTRAELLAPYADLKMKAGDARAAGDAFEELSRLHETSAALRPDDVGARSAYAITLARLAQAREMHGAYDQAGPLYKKAYDVFAALSAQKPDHPGLRAMAENARKDASRFSLA